jgi:hypothetical protein
MSTRFNKLALSMLAAVALFAGVGCGRPFKIETAPGFIELKNQESFAYRAATPEGVVVGVRVVEDGERADLTFWTKTVLMQLREGMSYALLELKDIESKDGTKGKLLRFGHDDAGKPFEYQVAVYVAQGRLFLVEAGAAQPEMDKARASVDYIMKSVKVRCSTLVSPVLASSTCNRW